MTIQCRTGCGQQVGYTQYQFSDGFLYVLFTDSDGSPHHCSNIPDNFYDEWKNSYDKDGNKIIENNYQDFFIDLISAQLGIEEDIEEDFKLYEQSDVNFKIFEKYLEQTKVGCNTFPIPFYEMDPERDDTVYSLTQLSDCYFQIGKYDDALLALSIQNQITNDQIKHITKLEKSQKNTPSDIITPTIQAIKEKIQKIEFMIKAYFRNIPINKLFEDNEEKRMGLEKLLKNQIVLDKSIEKDEIDVLTLGDCKFIICEHITARKKFPEWVPYRAHLMLISDFRNNILAHPNSENTDEMLNDAEKIAYNNFCDKLIHHLENINQK